MNLLLVRLLLGADVIRIKINIQTNENQIGRNERIATVKV